MWRRCGQKYPRRERGRRRRSPSTRTASLVKCSCEETVWSLCWRTRWEAQNKSREADWGLAIYLNNLHLSFIQNQHQNEKGARSEANKLFNDRVELPLCFKGAVRELLRYIPHLQIKRPFNTVLVWMKVCKSAKKGSREINASCRFFTGWTTNLKWPTPCHAFSPLAELCQENLRVLSSVSSPWSVPSRSPYR